MRARPLLVGSAGRLSSGWWGAIMVVLTEGALFSLLLFAYYYFAVQYGREWLPLELPKFHLSGPNTIILLASSVAVWIGERGIKRGSTLQLIAGLLAGILLGAVFVGIQYLEWAEKPFTISSSSYGSSYFTITGFHMAHVIGGLLALAAVLVWSALGYFDRHRHAAVSIAALYWHFVDAVWLTIFFTLYVTPYLG